MNACVNLMTERAKFVAAGARIGNAWAVAVLCLLGLVLPVAGWTWRHRAAVVRQREALDASYEPIRRMSGVNRAMSAEAAEFVAAEELVLKLSRRQPFVAVLNTVSEAIAQTDGAAYLEGLRFDQGAPAPDGGVAPRNVTLDVSCIASFDMALLVDLLGRPPFQSVKILSNSSAGEGSDRKTYVVQCQL